LHRLYLADELLAVRFILFVPYRPLNSKYLYGVTHEVAGQLRQIAIQFYYTKAVVFNSTNIILVYNLRLTVHTHHTEVTVPDFVINDIFAHVPVPPKLSIKQILKMLRFLCLICFL